MKVNDSVTLTARINNIHQDETAYVVLKDGQNVYTSLANCEPLAVSDALFEDAPVDAEAIVAKYVEEKGVTLVRTEEYEALKERPKSIPAVTLDTAKEVAEANGHVVLAAQDYEVLEERANAPQPSFTVEDAKALVAAEGSIVLIKEEYEALSKPAEPAAAKGAKAKTE